MDLEERAGVHAALGDPTRLTIVDLLVTSDRSPGEIGRRLGVPSNLLTHHLDVLERAGVVARVRSTGDRRRRYVTLRADAAPLATGTSALGADRVVFVCTANSARSLLACELWRARSDVPATSGGTEPAAAAHPGAARAARRAGVELRGQPGPIPELHRGDLVVTVCDRARERLESGGRRHADAERLHWSVPDPVVDGEFDTALERIDGRVRRLVPLVHNTN